MDQPSPGMMSVQDDLAPWLLLVANQDRDALRVVYDHQAGRLRGVALRILKDGALADDVLHDVFVRLMTTAARFDPARGSAAGFLAMLVRYASLDILRVRGRITILPPGDLGLDEQSLPALPGHDQDMLKHCLDRLGPETRRLILMTYIEGRTHTELAVLTKTPLGTVKSNIRRGLLLLRRCLEERCLEE